ncbi:MAG: NAD(P)H-binding protein [Alphaproteobacteria bacterium]|nr:NAD(P)H-binding protein [Alphaproteobacteria bacterium]
MRLFVIGGSGQLGRLVVGESLLRGHRVTVQSRQAARVPPWTRAAVGDPCDAGFLAAALPGHDAVLYALGVDHAGPTTLFSDSTRALIPAMQAAGVARLIAITGSGAGETGSHGGWLYNSIIHPLITRHRHADKNVQEEMIASSALDWTIIRPGPYTAGPLPGALTAVWPVPPDLKINAVTREEVAEYMLDVVEQHRWPHGRPLVGHLA